MSGIEESSNALSIKEPAIGPPFIEEIKLIPFIPISHPYIERVISRARHECLDQTLFWNGVNMQRKMNHFSLTIITNTVYMLHPWEYARNYW
jgi:hypothetical protein